ANFGQIRKPRDAAHNRKGTPAFGAGELPGHDLDAFQFGVVSQNYFAAAGRAGEKFQQSFFHGTSKNLAGPKPGHQPERGHPCPHEREALTNASALRRFAGRDARAPLSDDYRRMTFGKVTTARPAKICKIQCREST